MNQSNHHRAIIHVDMDAFFASVETYDNPELQGQAVIVGGLGNRGVVAAANYEARRFGVFSAMPIARARRLCPEGCYVRPRMARYREVSEQVFALFRDVTPLLEGLSLDEAFLDVSGSLKLLGSREQIGAALRDRILDVTGLQASVGMAHNKFLAKLASDAEKPAGFVSVDAQRVHEFLDPMPIGRLWGIGKKTEPRLRKLGLLTIGQLRTADPGVVTTALGNRTGHFMRLAAGLDDREVQSIREDKSISHEITFDVDIEDSRELQAEIQRQSEAVARRVRRQHLAAKTVHLKVRDRNFRTHTRSLTMRAPSDGTAAIYQVAKGLLKQWLKSNANTPVRLVGVGVSGFSPDEEGLTGTGRRIDTTMDEIASRFGTDKLSRGLTFTRNRKDRKSS